MAFLKKYRASKAAFLGLLFALSMILSLVESSLSSFIPVPGIKVGLSNIVTMYCLFCLGKEEALTITVLKSFFVLLTRGVTGAAMSFCGGMLSLGVMLALLYVKKAKLSYLFISICGGVAHNAGQLLMAGVLLKNTLVGYYFPILALSGILMGIITGILLRYLMPHLNKILR